MSGPKCKSGVGSGKQGFCSNELADQKPGDPGLSISGPRSSPDEPMMLKTKENNEKQDDGCTVNCGGNYVRSENRSLGVASARLRKGSPHLDHDLPSALFQFPWLCISHLLLPSPLSDASREMLLTTMLVFLTVTFNLCVTDSWDDLFIS